MRPKDFIGIAGIIIFAVSFIVDKLIVTIPNTLYFILMGIAIVLIVIGMVIVNKRRRE